MDILSGFYNGTILEKGYGQISQEIMRDKTISRDAKTIYAYLVSFAGSKDIAFPGRDLICEELGFKNKDTYYKYLKELKDKGLIWVEQQKDKNKKFSKNIYHIVLVKTQIDNKNSTISQSEPCPKKPVHGESRVPKKPYTVNRDTNINSSLNILDDDEETFLPAINIFVQAKGDITKLQKQTIKDLVNTYSIDFVVKAIQVTSDKAKVFNMSYVKKVLKSYRDNGFEKLKDIEDAENAEDIIKNNVNRKRKKNMIKQLEIAPKKSKSKNTSLEGDATYAETNQNTLDGFAELGY